MANFHFFFNFLRMIDIFGLKTEFQIDKKSKFTTNSGGFFTIIYVGFIILLFFTFGSDMINRVSPETTISQLFQPMPSPTEVSKESYFFVFGMQFSSGVHFVDEEIYTVSLVYGRKNETTLKTEELSLKAVPCDDSYLPSNPKMVEYFHHQAKNISDLYCVPQTNEKIILQGAWDQPRFGYLRLGIQPCNSSERKCKSDDEIKAALGKSYFALYGTDYLFDLTDYETPAHIFGRDYFIPTTYTQRKEIYRYFRTDKIVSDDGWIVSSVKESSYFSFDSNAESFDFQTNFGPMVTIEIRKSNYESTQSRKYKKIQSVFAEMTGFLQIIFVGLYFISSPFIKREYYETLTNSIYNFEVDDAQAENNKKKKKKGKKKDTPLEQQEKLKSILSNPHIKEIDGTEMVKGGSVSNSQQAIKKKKNDERIASYFLKAKESPLKMTFTETVKSNLLHDPVLDIKKSQRKTGISNIFSQLDIKYVLKKFSELEKLKMLLLNEDQFHLFEYLPKPVILKNSKIHLNYVKEKSLSPVKKSTFSGEIIHHHNDIISKVKTVQKSINNILKKKNEMSDVDKKLIESIDQDLVAILQDEEQIAFGCGTKEFIQVPRPPSIDLEKESVFSEKREEIIIKNSEFKGE